MTRAYRPWTTKELQFVRDHAAEGVEAICEHLDRSQQSVQQLASRFRVSLRRMRFSRDAARRSGLVYGIRVSSGVVKIGFTTDVTRRLGEFARHVPNPELLRVETGTVSDERFFHRMLAEYRVGPNEHFQNEGLVRGWVAGEFSLTDLLGVTDDVACR